MNFVERKNITFRIVSICANIVALAAMITSLVYVFKYQPKDVILSVIGLFLAISFVGMEIALLWRGKRKEPSLKNIAFNENDTINKFPVIVVTIGTFFSIGLLILSIIVFIQKNDFTTKCNMLVTGSIAIYLLVNCIVYYLLLIMYKKKPLNLEDLIK